MRVRIPILLLPVLLCCLFLFSSARCESGSLFLFRLRPQIDSADLDQEDGTVRIGTVRRKIQAARLRLVPEGRSQEGNTWDLSRLLKDHSGSVLSAWWHLEVRDPETITTRFVLLPEGSGRKNRQLNATVGWNLWDLSPWVEEMLTSGEDFPFTLQGVKKSGSNAASLDLRRSWIYCTLRLENPPAGLEALQVTDSELLDIAFSALPEGHWALKRYQEVAGSLTRSLWPETGVPYYFGGHSEEKVLHRYFPQQESKYYKADKLYLCGFDCGSFLHWVEEKAGYLPHDSLSTVLRHRASLFPLSGLTLGSWYQALIPGDLIAFNHGSLHVGMYLGTPRMYGLTAESAPELAEWLDSPLMIHCGEDPFCYDRFKAYIDTKDFRMTTSPPDGGVTVSLLVPDLSTAPHLREAPWGKQYGYFTVLDQPLTVFPLDDCTEFAWLHPVAE